MKKTSILLLSLFVLVTANATPQARDVLYWNGTKYYIFPYIDIESRLNANELERLNELKTEKPPTGNQRGYSYEFIIDSDTLFLISVNDAYKKDITESLFGGNIKMPMIFFSDTLYLGYGEAYYDHAWWTMVYESEITMFFQNGVVQWMKDNKNKSKQSPYTYNIQLFQEYIYSNIQWNELDFQTLQKKPIVYLGYETDSIDKIDNVKILRSSGYAQFDEEAVRVLKSIPSISVSFVKGKYIHHSYQVRIEYDTEKAKKHGVNIEAKLLNSPAPDEQLMYMLGESILKSKNKYEINSFRRPECHTLILCRDGLPNRFIDNNQSFYDTIGLNTLSWSNINTSRLKKELKQGIDVMEVSLSIIDNTIDIRVLMSTVKKKKNEIIHEYWTESIDQYIYEYSCETNEWRLKE